MDDTITSPRQSRCNHHLKPQVNCTNLTETELGIVAEQRPHGVGGDNLATFRGRCDARSLVDRVPQVVVLREHDVSDMQTDTNCHHGRLGPFGDRPLDLEGGACGLAH